MKRHHVLNILAAHIGAKTYLEIGVRDGKNLEKVKCPLKLGVDPDPTSAAGVIMTSDEFFKTNTQTFDLVFIDGLHLAEQVLRDVANSAKVLNEGGFIVLHDCLPKKEFLQFRTPRPLKKGRTTYPPWNGDVWKAWVALRNADVQGFIVNTDSGVGVLAHCSRRNLSDIKVPELSWADYKAMRNEPENSILCLVSATAFRG